MKVSILGAGAWGTALAVHLARAGHAVEVWARDPRRAELMTRERRNARYLEGVDFPERLNVVSKPGAVDAYVVAVPTQHIRETLEALKPELDPEKPFVSASKGIEIGTLELPTDIFKSVLGAKGRGVVSGPSHAVEVGRGLPASLVAAGTNRRFGEEIQALFMAPSLRVYTSADRLGVEIAGALKNVIAVAAGICDGLELGDNAKAALIVRGAVEIGRFGEALGADRSTFHGLAGAGDLIVTCTSRHGRNLRAGRMIGSGKRLDQVLQEMHQVAEGIWTCKAVVPWADKLGVEMPICREVVAVLYESKPPADAVRDLMARAPKAEA